MIECIRRECIADPNDLYHAESHICFVCGAEFDPSVELTDAPCEQCNWLCCPTCGCCKCSLSEADQAWLDGIRETVCQDLCDMVDIDLESIPMTENPNLYWGMTTQLRFCRRWATGELRRVAGELYARDIAARRQAMEDDENA